MGFKIAWLLALWGSTVMADTSSFECQDKRQNKIAINIDHSKSIPMERWEADGEDEANPFICYFHRLTLKGNMVFDCESYQGARYGYLTVPKALVKSMKISFLYIDENDGRIYNRFVGTCSMEHL